MSWFKKMLGMCEHNWETFKEITHTLDGYYYYTEYRQQCSKFGKIKSVNLNKPFLL